MKYWRPPLDQDRSRAAQGVVHIIEERCKGCGFCVEFCPRGVLVMSKHVNAKGYHPPEVIESTICADCRLCSLLCPDFAIYVESREVPQSERSESKTRNT